MATTTPKTLDIIKASAKDLTSTDPAKKARAEEIKKRYMAGAFNDKLVAEGAKPVPIKAPKIDLSKSPVFNQLATNDLSKPSPFGYKPQEPKKEPMAQEMFGDLKETGKALLDTAKETAKGIYEVGSDEDYNPVQKVAGMLGKLAGGVSGAFGDVVTGAGKMALSQDAEYALRGLAEMAGEKVSKNEKAMALAEGVTNWYNNLDKDNKLVVDTAGGMGAFMADIFGINIAKKPVQEALETTIKTGKEAIETAKPIVTEGIEKAGTAIKEGGEAVIKKGEEVVTKTATEIAEANKKEVEDAVGRILRPTGKTTAERAQQVEAGKRVLSEINTKEITDYQTFKDTLDARVKNIAESQDAHLAQFTEKYKPDQLATYTKVGGETVTTNPVIDALDGLENAYKISGDAVEATKLRQLRTKMESEGLTVAEINKIARQYNTEFKNKAFDKFGNPKAGFNAENYEAVRKGVKDVARDRMPDNVSKELDAKLSDSYEVRNLVDRLAVEVDKLGVKAQKQGILSKAIGASVEAVDILSGRTVSGLLRTLMQKSGALQRGTISYAELEAELTKNLDLFKSLSQKETLTPQDIKNVEAVLGEVLKAGQE